MSAPQAPAREPPRDPDTGGRAFRAWLEAFPERSWSAVGSGVLPRPPWWRWPLLAGAPLVAGLAALFGFGVAAGAATGALSVALVWWVGHARVERRRRECREALPDALSLMSAGLGAGHTLQQSLATAVRAGGPLAPEFARVGMLVRLGESVPDAVDSMASRLRSEELSWVAIAIRINSSVGGDLGVLLQTMAATIRERDVLRRTVRVLSAEGRLSAWVLAALPPAFVALMVLLRPSHLAPLVSQRWGWAIIGSSVLLFCLGVLWLRRAVRLEI